MRAGEGAYFSVNMQHQERAQFPRLCFVLLTFPSHIHIHNMKRRGKTKLLLSCIMLISQRWIVYKPAFILLC